MRHIWRTCRRARWQCLSAFLVLLGLWGTQASFAQTPATSADPFANPQPGRNSAPADTAAAGDAAPAALQPAVPKGIPTRFDELFEAGGILMWPIALCSLIAVGFSIERLVMLRRRRVIPNDFVSRFIEHLTQGKLDRQAALKLCEENASPVADVFAHGVRKWGKPSVEVEQAIIDGGERQVSQLRAHLRVINSVATISPLLGLLGTVIGMIQCFNDIAVKGAMGNAGALAEGIGVALITTAGGLTVAIPALIFYMYLVGRVDSLVMEMDTAAQKVVNLISAEAFSTQPPTAARPTPVVKPRPPAPSTTPPAQTPSPVSEPREVKRPVAS